MNPVRNLFVTYRVLNGVGYIMNNYKSFQIDEVGQLIWESIDGNTSVEGIVEKVVQKYNEDYTRVMEDVQEFLDDLRKNELIA